MSMPKLSPKGGAAGPDFRTGWDLVRLGRTDEGRLPGKSRVTKGAVKLRADKKSKDGSDGASPTFHGIDPQVFEIENETWTDNQRELLLKWCQKFLPRAGKIGDPISLHHPSVAVLGDVVMVKVTGATPLIETGERGRTKMTIELLHWLRPKAGKKSATATPVRAIRDLRAEDAAKKNNPLPSQQPATFAPPAGPPATAGQ